MTIITKPTLADNPSGALILYDNLLVSASFAEFEPALTPTTFDRYDASTSSNNVLLQLASPAAIDSICIGAHTLGRFGDLTLTVEVATTVGGALTEVYEQLITDNEAIFISIPSQTVGEVKLTWLATDTSNPLEIGVVSAGLALQMPRNIYGGHSPVLLSRDTKFNSSISESGQFIGRTVRQTGYKGSLDWRYLDDDWYRSTFNLFVLACETKPFFIKWRPDYYNEAVYAQTIAPVKASNMGGGHRLMSASVSIRAHADI